MHPQDNAQYTAKPKRSKAAPAQLDFGLAITDPEAHRIQSARKPRRCLSCDRTFQSHGPGNRICSGCKETDAWSSSGSFDIAINAAF